MPKSVEHSPGREIQKKQCLASYGRIEKGNFIEKINGKLIYKAKG